MKRKLIYIHQRTGVCAMHKRYIQKKETRGLYRRQTLNYCKNYRPYRTNKECFKNWSEQLVCIYLILCMHCSYQYQHVRNQKSKIKSTLTQLSEKGPFLEQKVPHNFKCLQLLLPVWPAGGWHDSQRTKYKVSLAQVNPQPNF